MSENKNKQTDNKKKDPLKEAGKLFSPKDSGDGNKRKFNIYWVYGAIALIFILIQFLSMKSGPKEITRHRFEKEMLLQHEVSKIVVVNREKVEIYIKPQALNNTKYDDIKGGGVSGTNSIGPHYYFTIGSVEVFENQFSEATKEFTGDQVVSVSYETRTDFVGEIIGYLLPIIIIIGIWIFFFRRMGGAGGSGGSSIFNVGKSKAKIYDKETNVQVNFTDVAGLAEAKVEVMEIVDFLKKPEKYTNLGGKIPKGALLVGPPGTGKTLLARAVAGEAHVPFFSMSGSDFVEMFVGVGASRVRDLFKQAKEKSPCIIFIDEIDAIGRARGKNPNMGANDERENTLNQLLTEMDGFSANTGVIILAATNRADILDRALMRAGRFDRQIHVELPDLDERKEIFKVHMKGIKVDKTLDFEFFAKQTPGFSGADIANVCNESALIAARKDKKKVGKQDFLDAVDRIIGGLEKKNKVITMEEKETIAYHEAGHATTSWLLKYANPLVKVTIVPRGKALGAAWYLPEERQITTKEQMFDEMCAALGGRAAEELVFKTISTGALNDLEKVTKQAYAMISYFGMSEKVGHISYYDSSGQNEYAFNKPYSEETAELIDKEVSELIDKAYKRVLKLLEENKEGLTKLAKLLIEKEVIFTDDVVGIFGKRNFGPTRTEQIEELNRIRKQKEDEEKEKKEEKAKAENVSEPESEDSKSDDNEASAPDAKQE